MHVAEVSELHAWDGGGGEWPYSCNRKEVWGTLDILSSAFLGEERGLLKHLKTVFRLKGTVSGMNILFETY
jgi:hypothetical protein